MTAAPLPEWLIPPEGGFTADDLDRLPNLPPHTELIDGSLVFMSPQRRFHTLVMFLLESRLREQVPESLYVVREMSVVLGKHNCPEPDISIVRAEAVSEAADETRYLAEDVVLAVEVVSPDSEERDRDAKPHKYAAAGIPHFWRVEQGKGRRPVVYVYELDPATREYALTGIHRETMKLAVPFELTLDLTEMDRL